MEKKYVCPICGGLKIENNYPNNSYCKVCNHEIIPLALPS